ncbi:hypothetical protein [Vitiosangium sp. GDMCC 1.1324]|uniref:hypothetical protein n=1 Tax=Vitiosangium sp. (strain GDMCC 1.1324) TaxID=2138576 RepID=UPI0011B7E1F5|nr:hypothetical protein [Vitiosangium sp. GDMCC 1.1324]
MSNHPRIATTASRRGWNILALCLATAYALAASPSAHAQDKEPEPIPEEEVYQEKVLDQGEGWTLRNISGYTVDDTGEYFSRDVYTVSDPKAVFELSLSNGLREEIVAEFERSKERGEEGLVLSVDKRIADEIAISEEMGELTPYLKQIAESAEDGKVGQRLASCSSVLHSWSKSFSFNTPIGASKNFGGGFSGSLSTTGNISGGATGEVVTATKRVKIFGACIPYSVGFDHAHIYGNAAVSHGTTVNGTLNYGFSWSDEIAKPYLGSVTAWVGPLPVHIGFNLPINLGLDINASASGTVAYNGQQTATGSFDYTCSTGGCSGSASYSLGSAPTPQPVTGSVSGHIYPTVWAQVAVRAYLYNEWLAHAQVGARPYLYGDLWGYYGNTCGDADGDGTNETVSASTFDLDWQLFITARASAAGYSQDWNNLWSTSRRHIRFWDLVGTGSTGSTAFRPLLLGPSSVPMNNAAPYTTRMRPCWPYSDPVSFKFTWGDGTLFPFTAAPSTPTTQFKSWSYTGPKTVQAAALNDSHGRVLNAYTARSINVTASTPTWTQWISRDDAGGYGDFETLAAIQSEGYAVCSNPIAIECRTISGVPWNSTGQVYSCSLPTGGYCYNAQQSNGMCQDYQVRFLCP